MRVTPMAIEDVLLVEPDVFGDERGFFLETWRQTRYRQMGVQGPFVQDNLSRSEQGILRGLHYQHPHGQGKLVYVVVGEVYDVAVDLRVDSPTFKQWVGVELSDKNRAQLFIPAGFAHGFVVTGEQAIFAYKCTEEYRPDCDRNLAWNDPDIGIDWPIAAPRLSAKDQKAPRLRDVGEEHLPRVAGDRT